MLSLPKHTFYVTLFGLALLVAACAPTPPTATQAEIAEPPVARLTVNGVTQSGGTGSYCWSPDPQDTSAHLDCVDVAGIPTAAEPLVLTDFPAQAEFRLESDRMPDSVILSVQPVTAGDELASQDNAHRWWQPAEGWSGGLPANNPVTYVFDNDEFGDNGLYVIQVQYAWQGTGDAVYGFLVQIGAEDPSDAVQPSIPAPTPAAVTLQTLDPLARLGNGAASSLALSPDGRRLAVNTPLGVYVYETATLEEIWSMPLTNYWRVLAFSPNGEKLAIGAQAGGVLVVEVASGEELYYIPTGESGQPDWSPDGEKLLTGAGCEEVKVWDAQTGAPLATVQEAQCNNAVPGIVRAVWSGDGSRVYVSVGNGYVLAYDASTSQPLAGYAPHPPEFGFSRNLVPSPTKDLFALSNGLSVAIMDGSTGEMVAAFEADLKDTALDNFAWSPDGLQLAAGNGSEVVIWDTKTGKQIHSYPGFLPLNGLAWMPDGQTLAGLLAEDGSLNAINVETGETAFSLPGFGRVNSYSTTFKWEGDQLLTTDGANILRWEARTGALLDQEPDIGQASWAKSTGYALAPDAARYASPDAVYDIQSHKTITELRDNPDHTRDQVAWSPDGLTLASGSSLGFSPLILWDAVSGQPLLECPTGSLDPYLGGLAFSPDGKLLAGGGSLMNPANGLDNGILILWDPKTGELTRVLTAGMAGEQIMALAWSADGHWLAAGMYSGRIVLWDMLTLQPSINLAGHKEGIIGLGWSPDGRLLASNSHDGTVLVWEMPLP